MNPLPRLRRAFFSAVTWAAALAGQLGVSVKGVGERVIGRVLYGIGGIGGFANWSANRHEQVRHYRGWTYIAVRIIAETAAGAVPQVGYIRTKEQVRKGLCNKSALLKPYDPLRKAVTTAQPHEDIELVDSDHPLLKLLKNPNGPDVGWTFWYKLVMFLELTGNAYIWVIENKLGEPAELHVLPSHWVTPRSDGEQMVAFYDIRPQGVRGGGTMMTFPADEVIHIALPNPLDPLDGYSPLSAGAEWTDVDESIHRSRWWSFLNKALPSTVFELEKDVKDPDQPTVDRFKAQFAERYVGEEHAREPMILPPGVKANAISFSPTEMDYNTSAELSRDMVLSLHQISKTLAGISDDVNYAGYVASVRAFYQRKMKPIFTLLSQILSEKLAPRFEAGLIVFWPDVTPDDPQQKVADYQAAGGHLAVTPNEWRKNILGLDPYEHGGDDPVGSPGIVPIPLNTGDDLTALADLIPKPGGQGQQPGMPGQEGQPGEGAAAPPGHPGADNELMSLLGGGEHGVAGQGPPGKALLNGHMTKKNETLREAIAREAAKVEAPKSDAQKEAGNYPKGHVTIQGLPITIENAKGSTRSGKSQDGKEWSVTMGCHYGYVKRTESEADGDHLDVFIGPDPESELVFVIDQLRPDRGREPRFTRFDEHKCMLGFTNEKDARDGYLANYSKGWTGLGGITAMMMTAFKEWMKGDTGKPVSDLRKQFQGKALDPIRIHIPDLQQAANFTCGASCFLSIAEYFGVGPETESEFVTLLDSDPELGTDPRRIVSLGRALGLSVYPEENMTLARVEQQLVRGRPVLVLLQAWGGEERYADDENGHYCVIVGLDEENVYLEDPMLKGARGSLSREEFLERWHDEGRGEKYVRWGCAFWRVEQYEPIKRFSAADFLRKPVGAAVGKSERFEESKHPRADDGKFGEGGGSAKPPKESGPKLSPAGQERLAKFSAAIDGAKLSDEQKAAYKNGLGMVFTRMPDKAIAAVKDNVKAVQFHATPADIGVSLSKQSFCTDQDRARLAKMAEGGSHPLGVYCGGVKGLMLDGKTKTQGGEAAGGIRENHHEVYAHELSHALDGSDYKHSNAPEWQAAWKEEIDKKSPGALFGRLSDYARHSPAEGWAEFGRLVYATDRDAKFVEATFPKCAAIWRKAGFIE